MDNKELEVSRKKLAGLDRQLSDLAVRQRSTEGRLAQEHQIVRQSASQRAVLVAKLVDSSEEEARRLHKSIDSMDAQIKASERLAESYQELLKTIASETADVTSQRDRLNQTVGQENTSRQFQQWAEELKQARAEAERAFATARLKLSQLDRLCAEGIEKFPGAGNVAAATFDDLLVRQANLEMNGWKLSTPVFRSDAIIHIRPLIPR